MDGFQGPRALPPRAVVVGYDERPVAQRALDWAAEEADRGGHPLVVVHATGAPATIGVPAETWLNLTDPATEPTAVEVEQHGRALLARALARVGLHHPSLTVLPAVVPGEPAAELARSSRTARLVVVGSRGHGVSRSVPTGQVGAWLAKRAACPLVVVPDYNAATVRQGVLAGLPLSEDASVVLDFAFAHASLHGLPLTVVHAAGQDTEGPAADRRRRHVAELLSGRAEDHPDVHVRSLLLSGRPAGNLLRMAERMNLLVVGRHHATGLHRSPFGHVRGSVVDRSPCPTAVVPARVPEPA